MPLSREEFQLTELMARVSKDPLEFVKVSFPWGEPGELEDHPGPDKWQSKVLSEIRDGLKTPNEIIQEAVAAGNGVGKAQAYDDIVPTPNGLRRWGDLEPGDEVFGADGAPTKILQCHHYTNIPMYRVTFDDGSYAEVSSGHLWNVRGRRERRYNLPGWRTLETADIAELGTRYKNGSGSGTREWEIPIQGAVQFLEREIPLHPYLVGVWLGDGSKGKPAYTKPSEEMAERIRSLGYDMTKEPNGDSRYILGVSEHFKDGVFSLGSPHCYIPDEYKFNSVENRKALLEGLLDTDGEVTTNASIGYSTTSQRLADDVIWLARSLGCKAKLQAAVKHGWYPGPDGERVLCRDCYRITLSVPWNPFTLEHRRVRYRPAQVRYQTRWIDSIEPIDPADGMCITVAAQDGLYQANDFIVTHNSGLVSWLILWALATFPGSRVVVTANTEGQLRTKTWPELAKWYRLFLARHWFRMTATSVFSVDPARELEWRADAIPWSETNPQAFAGLHNRGKRLLLIMDEASEINDIIWETAEGAMTDADTQILWCVFGNPTQNTGRFRDCFDRFAHRWKHHHVDQRDCRIPNRAQIAKWVEDYGEEDDWFRVHVRGIFPRFGSRQFISGELVRAAMSDNRQVIATVYDPLIMGVDVARFGDNKTVIAFRRGYDARAIPLFKMHGADTMEVASRVMALFEEYKPDALFVDEGGVGGGVVDRLRMLRYPVLGVQFGARANNNRDIGEGRNNYYNLRSEIFGLCRDWLRRGTILYDKDLLDGLSAPYYSHRSVNGVDSILLEKKDDVKSRTGVSCDEADAFCITFAYDVQPTDHTHTIAAKGKDRGFQSAYDPYASAWNLPQQEKNESRQHWLPGKDMPNYRY